MAGLDPAIHAAPLAQPYDVDARIKSGHDGIGTIRIGGTRNA
jgi:hypothetical protein